MLYRIAGMFGSGKVWQITRIVRDSSYQNHLNTTYIYSVISLWLIYPFTKLYFANHFLILTIRQTFIYPTKYSRYMIFP